MWIAYVYRSMLCCRQWQKRDLSIILDQHPRPSYQNTGYGRTTGSGKRSQSFWIILYHFQRELKENSDLIIQSQDTFDLYYCILTEFN